jgi:pyrroline-5-carboxylate reductase
MPQCLRHKVTPDESGDTSSLLLFSLDRDQRQRMLDKFISRGAGHMTPLSSPASGVEALANVPGAILLAGAGKMGSALLQGWLSLGLPPDKVIVTEPQPSSEVKELAAKGVRLNPPQVNDAGAIVIAVKPQAAPEVLPTLLPFVGSHTVVVSIMAGRPLHYLETAFPSAALVRAMPNTPAAIGRGITVAVTNGRASSGQRDLVHALLTAVGAVEWIEDESLMDAVTALSGSGPAYVFLLAESMAQAGRAAGLPSGLSEALARATVAGSGELLRLSPLDPATLRQNVTSPSGTTAAALDILMGHHGLKDLMTRAIAAAAKRSRELAR